MKKNLQVSPRYKKFKLDTTRISPLRIVRDEDVLTKKTGFSKRFVIVSIISVSVLVAGYFVVNFVLKAINDENVPQQIRQPGLGGERTFL